MTRFLTDNWLYIALLLCLCSCTPKPCVADREAVWAIESLRRACEPCPERVAIEELTR